jgi:hypothetical protein
MGYSIKLNGVKYSVHFKYFNHVTKCYIHTNYHEEESSNYVNDLVSYMMDEKMFVGISKCKFPDDVYSKKEGEKLALDKAIFKLKNYLESTSKKYQETFYNKIFLDLSKISYKHKRMVEGKC